MATLGIGIFTFLNIKSARDIRTQVNQRFKADVETLIAKKVAQFEKFIEETQTRITGTETKLHELSGSLHDLIDGITFAFAALDENRNGSQWDPARRVTRHAFKPVKTSPHRKGAPVAS
jgi:hypothetical protein